MPIRERSRADIKGNNLDIVGRAPCAIGDAGHLKVFLTMRRSGGLPKVIRKALRSSTTFWSESPRRSGADGPRAPACCQVESVFLAVRLGHALPIGCCCVPITTSGERNG